MKVYCHRLACNTSACWCYNSEVYKKYLPFLRSELLGFCFFSRWQLQVSILEFGVGFSKIDKIRLIYYPILLPSFICWSEWNMMVLLGHPTTCIISQKRPSLPILIYLAWLLFLAVFQYLSVTVNLSHQFWPPKQHFHFERTKETEFQAQNIFYSTLLGVPF